MIRQKEEFAFWADHSTGYRCAERHGHNYELRVTTSWEGDHCTIRGTVGRVLSRIHGGHLNEIEGLPGPMGATVERTAQWIGERLAETPLGECRIELTELSASPTFEMVRHTKVWEA